MRKRAIQWLVLVPFLLQSGCVMFYDQKELESKYGVNPPNIVKTYAQSIGAPGENMRIYLEAEDNDGDMSYIQVTVDRPGMLEEKMIPLPGRLARRLSGYFILTHQPGDVRGMWEQPYYFHLKIIVVDKANHTSQVIDLPLEMDWRKVQAPPPHGAYENVWLGTVYLEQITENVKPD